MCIVTKNRYDTYRRYAFSILDIYRRYSSFVAKINQNGYIPCCLENLVKTLLYLYPPQCSGGGVYWNQLVCPSVRLSIRLSVNKILSGELLRNYWTDFDQIWHRCSLWGVVMHPRLASPGAVPKGGTDRKCKQKRAF